VAQCYHKRESIPSMGLRIHRTLRSLQRGVKLSGRLLNATSRLVEENVFKALAALVSIGALVIVAKEVVAPEPHAAAITAAGVLTVVAALFACFGVEMIKRLKKLGPLELFAEANTLIARLASILREAPEMEGTDPLSSERRLSLREQYHYRQADLYVSQIDFTGADLTDAKHKRKYCELLLSVAYTAHRQGDWVRAVEIAKKLEEVDEAFRIDERLGVMAGAHFTWADALSGDEDRRERRDLFAKAWDSCQRLVGKGTATASIYFASGYIEHEFGDYEKALRSYESALREQPRFAPAKYNKAISCMKLHRMQEALYLLQSIDAEGDLGGQEVLDYAPRDKELQQILLERDKGPDRLWVLRIRRFLKLSY
jgi:tetratricopeptide (TPR) repeat protein